MTMTVTWYVSNADEKCAYTFNRFLHSGQVIKMCDTITEDCELNVRCNDDIFFSLICRVMAKAGTCTLPLGMLSYGYAYTYRYMLV